MADIFGEILFFNFIAHIWPLSGDLMGQGASRVPGLKYSMFSKHCTLWHLKG